VKKRVILSCCLLLLFGLGSCQKAPERKGYVIIKRLRQDFEEITKEEDLAFQTPKIKKRLQKLTKLMQLAAENASKGDKRAQVPEEYLLESDRLCYEMLRVCEEVEGARPWLENLQKDMLDKLDVYQRKTQKRH